MKKSDQKLLDAAITNAEEERVFAMMFELRRVMKERDQLKFLIERLADALLEISNVDAAPPYDYSCEHMQTIANGALKEYKAFKEKK